MVVLKNENADKKTDAKCISTIRTASISVERTDGSWLWQLTTFLWLQTTVSVHLHLWKVDYLLSKSAPYQMKTSTILSPSPPLIKTTNKISQSILILATLPLPTPYHISLQNVYRFRRYCLKNIYLKHNRSLRCCCQTICVDIAIQSFTRHSGLQQRTKFYYNNYHSSAKKIPVILPNVQVAGNC